MPKNDDEMFALCVLLLFMATVLSIRARFNVTERNARVLKMIANVICGTVSTLIALFLGLHWALIPSLVLLTGSFVALVVVSVQGLPRRAGPGGQNDAEPLRRRLAELASIFGAPMAVISFVATVYFELRS
ncbi:hypothetical protein ACWGJ2_04275 [Streptomyces sp. NPDC054796]